MSPHFSTSASRACPETSPHATTLANSHTFPVANFDPRSGSSWLAASSASSSALRDVAVSPYDRLPTVAHSTNLPRSPLRGLSPALPNPGPEHEPSSVPGHLRPARKDLAHDLPQHPPAARPAKVHPASTAGCEDANVKEPNVHHIPCLHLERILYKRRPCWVSLSEAVEVPSTVA